MSRWTDHAANWKNCDRCPLHLVRSRVVLARGKLPCDVLFLGEAPGESEDALGEPFVGPAGKLLDRAAEEAFGGRFRLAFTNVVGCIPKVDGEKASEPSFDEIEACAPRVVELVEIAAPRLIVRVGACAQNSYPFTGKGHAKFLPLETPAPTLDLQHPAFILRQNVTQRGLLFQRMVVQLHQAIEEFLS